MNTSFIASETTVSPVAGQNNWSQPIYFMNDQIMLKDYFGLGSTGKYVSYAFTYFNAPADQQAVLWVGSDEALKIYVNEQLVYNYSGTRSFTTEYYKDNSTLINLRQGVNKLLVKAYQSTGSYNFSLNVCDVESDVSYQGNRVSGLKFKTANATVGVKENKPAHPTTFQLNNCYPNPFNPTTQISYRIDAKSNVSIVVYDLSGREVGTLVNREQDAGTFMTIWNAQGMSSGLYLCRLTVYPKEGGVAEVITQVKKMILIK
jgi:hypothetical protein